MQVGHRIITTATANIGIYGIALNGTGANERHFNNDVVKGTWLDSRQCGHLSTGFHLEDPNGVGLAEEVVDRFFLGQLAQVQGNAVG